MCNHKFWKTCSCGEEFLTIGSKVKCNNCLLNERRERLRDKPKPIFKVKYCSECGEEIPHRKHDGITRYMLKKTCGKNECRMKYYHKNYGYNKL